MKLLESAKALMELERTVAAVKGQLSDSKLAKALATLTDLARKEDMPLAIVGGLAAIHYGYERFTKDIDVVVRDEDLEVLPRVAPRYGIKVIWSDPEGWHKLQCEGVAIDVVPEGRKARKDAPTAIPGPEELGVHDGLDYAALAGWMELKLASYRVQDQADVVQVIKTSSAATLRGVRKRITQAHPLYGQRFDELNASAKEELEQERQRGGRK